MGNDIEAAVNAAIKLLAEKITPRVSFDEALKYTQAALNLAHVAHLRQQTHELKRLA